MLVDIIFHQSSHSIFDGLSSPNGIVVVSAIWAKGTHSGYHWKGKTFSQVQQIKRRSNFKLVEW